TVKRADGTYVTLVGQRGTVTEVTGTKLTVKSEDGYTHSYVLDGSTKFRSASDPKGPALKASDLKTGDEVAVRAQRNGSDDTATVKRADGTYVTLVGQRGTVTEVTGTKLTVKSE
ncbi:hypothetical protein CTI14_54150, partial [Methylobacterium radiotolerans]